MVTAPLTAAMKNNTAGEKRFSALAAATATTAAPAASGAAAAAPADDHLHGAGLSHDRQFIAESSVVACTAAPTPLNR
jgi:hypothetical protein